MLKASKEAKQDKRIGVRGAKPRNTQVEKRVFKSRLLQLKALMSRVL